jgi:general L-amino acid transport system permease protein
MKMAASTKLVRPPKGPDILTWIRSNLFNNWYNSLLTIISVAIIYWAASGILRWIIFSADWKPVLNFPLLYLVGQYPRDQLWRIGSILWGTALMFGISWGLWGNLLRSFSVPIAVLLGLMAFFPTQSESFNLAIRAGLLINPLLIMFGHWLGRRKWIQARYVVIAWIVLLVLSPFILGGFDGNTLLPSVGTTYWGGLLVTLLLAIGGITLSFPIGVLLALGRRSSLPVVKLFSTLFIELVRGVPLVTILFMFSLILTLFLPPESRIDRLMRALLAMIFFSAAYTAENVRGGLQSVSSGQIEAAKAIGLNNFQTTILIVLPQALRAVIPAIVGQYIRLFKDTTLAIIVGISELLFIGRSILNSDPAYIRRQFEVYLFIGAIFWVFSYIMSSASRRLETTLGVGER